MSFSSGRRPTSCARLGRERQSPEPNRTKNALACTQCTARSVRLNRSSRRLGGIAIRSPYPGVLVVAVLLPVTLWLLGDELHLREPLDPLVAVHLREDHARRRAVRARQRLVVELQRKHRVRQSELIERQRIFVRAL